MAAFVTCHFRPVVENTEICEAWLNSFGGRSHSGEQSVVQAAVYLGVCYLLNILHLTSFGSW